MHKLTVSGHVVQCCCGEDTSTGRLCTGIGFESGEVRGFACITGLSTGSGMENM